MTFRANDLHRAVVVIDDGAVSPMNFDQWLESGGGNESIDIGLSAVELLADLRITTVNANRYLSQVLSNPVRRRGQAATPGRLGDAVRMSWWLTDCMSLGSTLGCGPHNRRNPSFSRIQKRHFSLTQ